MKKRCVDLCVAIPWWIGHTWRKTLRFSSGSGQITSLLLRGFSGAGQKPEGFPSKCDQTMRDLPDWISGPGLRPNWQYNDDVICADGNDFRPDFSV